VKVKELLHHDDELKLFSPLGCGFQTGMGAIQNIASAGLDDIVMIQGLGAVGMGALMVRVTFCQFADLYALVYKKLTTFFWGF
jgi:Zn-dependent alcohol dehydrogenase